MWNIFNMGPAGTAFGFGGVAIALLFLVIALWSLVWKTLAVWHAARNKQRIWMVVLLLVNTVGVLEIITILDNKSVTEILANEVGAIR